MISSTLIGPLGILLATASTVVAFDDISIPYTVEADTEVTVELTNDIADGSRSFDAGFTNFNLYLATTPPGWGTGPVCLLANGTKIDSTSVKIKIPADVAPASANLKITAMEWNSDPYKDGPSGFEYSNTFRLEGGTGTWSKSEKAGEDFGDMDHIPCSAYACARKCSDKYYDERHKNEEDINSYKSTYECIAACPGTTYPSWASVISQDGDEGSGHDDSSTSTDSAETATATAKASGASTTVSTSTVASSTPTSSSSSTQAASSPSETTGGVGQVSVKTAGLVFAGLVAAYGLF